MQWVLTADEFTHVWHNETGRDRRPHPIDLTPRGTAGSERARTALALDDRFPTNGDPDLTATIRFLARSDVTRITACGDELGGIGNPAGDQPNRHLAVAVAYGAWGAVLYSGPGQLTVHACHARSIGRYLVTAIRSGSSAPPNERRRVPAGSTPELRESRDTVLAPPTWIPTGSRGPAEQMRRSLRRPLDARGLLTVTMAPDDPMSPPPAHRTWLDITGDGRYLLNTGSDLVLTPIDEPGLATELLRLAGIS